MDDTQKAWADAHVGEQTTARTADGEVASGSVTGWTEAPDDTVQGGVLVTFTLDNRATFTAVPPLSDEQVAAIEQARADEVARQEEAARQAALAAQDNTPPPLAADVATIIDRLATAIGADPEALRGVLAGNGGLK